MYDRKFARESTLPVKKILKCIENGIYNLQFIINHALFP